MLLELTITNFAIIDSLHLRLARIFNVFTGETGAGKSIIVDAISALVGERVGADVVRAGRSAQSSRASSMSARLLAARDERRYASHRRSAAEDEGASSEAETLTCNAGGAGHRRRGWHADSGTRDCAGGSRLAACQWPGGAALHPPAHRRLSDRHPRPERASHHLRPEQHVFYLDRYAATDDLRQQVTGLVGDWRAARRELERLQRDERELERQRRTAPVPGGGDRGGEATSR